MAYSSPLIRHPDDHRPITKFSFCSPNGPASLPATVRIFRRTQGDVVHLRSAPNIHPWRPPSYMSRSIPSHTMTLC